MSNIRWLLAIAFAVAFVPAGAIAQESGTVQGSVVDATTQEPLSGAQVTVRNTGRGTLTDAQGRYLILNVPSGQQVVDVQLIGYASGEQTVTVPAGGAVTANFTLQESAVALEGVVVTALGLEREQRELGVAATSIPGEELSRVETNVVNTLSGKVAGVNITNTGPQGGSSRIVIRGENSITGDNDPLFVVDGVPIDNYSTGGYMNTGQGGYDYGNAAQDIDPAAIQSITVLKGPNAAAIYGSRASNGAVIITTKKGRGATGGADIVVSQNVTFEDELRLPDYQDEFGQGSGGLFAYYDGDGNGVFDEFDESWGPPLDVGLTIPQFHSPIDPATGERVPLPWVSHPNNVDEFFEIGRTINTNVSVAAASDRLNGRFGVSHLNQDGMVPGFELERTTLSFGGGMDLNDRFNVTSSIQYITANGENRPGVGYDENNPMQQFVWFGRQVDVGILRERYQEVRPEGDPMEGLPFSWNYRYHPNPYFLQLSNGNADERDRLIGQITANYQFTDWLGAQLRSGTDWYQDRRMKTYAANNFGGLYTTNPLDLTREYVAQTGAFGSWDMGFQETNTDFLLSANPELDSPFSITANFGGNRRDFERVHDYVWVGQLATPGVFDLGNAAITPDAFDFTSRKQVNSLYGQTDLGYNNVLFLTLTGRNDWSSTLPEDNRSYFYPSVSGSFIFSDAIPALANTPFLNYGKLRASWAQVGNDTDPYQLRNTFAPDQIFGELPSFTVPGQLNNAELKPEITESVEFGAELAFLDDRLGLDVTYYTEETRDQIMPVEISRATGYTSRLINAGTVQNKGWEVLLRGTPVQMGDFRWESTVTWAKNDSKVLELAPGVEGLELSIGDFWGAQVFAREGEPLGQIVGTDYLRVEDPNSPHYGRVIVHPIGIPRWTPTPQVIGNFNPDWRAGVGNEFSYKGARLNVLFDIKHGGEIYSVTQLWGRYAGVLQETVDGRCSWPDPADPNWEAPPGYPACTAETGIVVDGVQRVINGSDTTYVENDVVVDAQTYGLTGYYVAADNIMDAGFVKLREMAFTYDLPGSFTNRLGVNGLQLGVIGRNLALWTENPHIDPESGFDDSNVQGYEYGQMPTARSIGINITVRP